MAKVQCLSEAQCEELCKEVLSHSDFNCCKQACKVSGVGAGISFSLILALMMKYGPQAIALIKEIIDQLQPTPAPLP